MGSPQTLTDIILRFQYESYSKRIIPEVLNFFATAFMILGPTSMKISPIPGSFPLGDMQESAGKERLSGLKLRSKLAAKCVVRKADLPSLLELETEDASVEEQEVEQHKVDMLALNIRLIRSGAEMYSEAEAYLEIFQPLLELMKALEASKIPKELKVSCKSIQGTLKLTTLHIRRYAKKRSTDLLAASNLPLKLDSRCPCRHSSPSPFHHTHPSSTYTSLPHHANTKIRMQNAMRPGRSRLCTKRSERVRSESSERTTSSWLWNVQRSRKPRMRRTRRRCDRSMDQLPQRSEQRRRRWRGKSNHVNVNISDQV